MISSSSSFSGTSDSAELVLESSSLILALLPTGCHFARLRSAPNKWGRPICSSGLGVLVSLALWAAYWTSGGALGGWDGEEADAH